jgi:hypothetical protein
MRDVADVADDVGAGERSERIWHELEILALFDRCRSLHRGVLLLLSQETFVHEAVILVRPLFTDSLALAEFAAVDERRRGSLVVGWALWSEQQMRAFFLDRRSRGHDVAAELERIAEREGWIRKYALNRGYGTQRWQPDDHAKRLAVTHGRASEYSALLVAQMFVHGTTTVTSERYAKTDEGLYVVGGPAPTPRRCERDTGIFASHSMPLAARAACEMFGWTEPSEFGELLDAVRREGQRPR